MTIQAGERIAHYELVVKVGEGGMGVVWRALDGRLGRDVAVKVLPEELEADPESLARFEREARVLAALSHPNIVTIYLVEEDRGRHVLTMELVPGVLLSTLIPPRVYLWIVFYTSACRSLTRSAPPTTGASSTGISSPRTSW